MRSHTLVKYGLKSGRFGLGQEGVDGGEWLKPKVWRGKRVHTISVISWFLESLLWKVSSPIVSVQFRYLQKELSIDFVLKTLDHLSRSLYPDWIKERGTHFYPSVQRVSHFSLRNSFFDSGRGRRLDRNCYGNKTQGRINEKVSFTEGVKVGVHWFYRCKGYLCYRIKSLMVYD